MTTLIHSFLSFCYYCSIWPNSCKISHQEAEYTFEHLGKKVDIFFTESSYTILKAPVKGVSWSLKTDNKVDSSILLTLVEETKRFLYEPS